MATGNFFRYKADYIYVPISFRDLEDVKEEEVDFIYEDANTEVEEFLDDLKKLNIKYKDYIAYFTEDYKLERNREIIGRINIEGDNDFLDILIIKAYGYYEAFNIDYDYNENSEIFKDKNFLKIFNKVINILEDTLSKHFDRIKVFARFSSGETWYKRVE